MGSNIGPSDAQLRQFSEALKQHNGNAAAAGDSLGVAPTTARRWRRIVTGRGFDGSIPEPVPEGYALKGTSTLYGADGEVKAQWVKTDREKEQLAETIETIKETLSEIKPKAPKIPKPVNTDSDTLAFYPLPDLHMGLLAWGEETGEDWDISLATERYKDTMLRVAADTPNSSQAIVLGGGDLLHSDNYKGMTSQSGNILDCDSRYPKILKAAIEIMVYQIDLARTKHERVIVRNLPGNHDEASAIAVTYALWAWYRDDERVEVDIDPSLFWWFQFGATALGSTHGHAAKAKDMPMIMATRKPDMWAAAKHRFIHTFHVHHGVKMMDEYGGCICEVHQSPAKQDAWHFGMGYISGRSMQSKTYHKEHGEYACTPRAMAA